MWQSRRRLIWGAPVWLAGCAAGPRSPLPQAEGWHEFRLPGKLATRYTWDRKEGVACWHARAERSASMWRRHVLLGPEAIGEVEFSWWVDRTLPAADMSERDAEDSPARVMFAFDGDAERLPAKHRMMSEMAQALSGEPLPFATLMYVWSNEDPLDRVLVNPRTDRIRKIVVERGADNLRRWRFYRRDLAADFRRAFGEPPGPLRGIALMTDADNTGGSADTWYGDVRLR